MFSGNNPGFGEFLAKQEENGLIQDSPPLPSPDSRPAKRLSVRTDSSPIDETLLAFVADNKQQHVPGVIGADGAGSSGDVAAPQLPNIAAAIDPPVAPAPPIDRALHLPGQPMVVEVDPVEYVGRQIANAREVMEHEAGQRRNRGRLQRQPTELELSQFETKVRNGMRLLPAHEVAHLALILHNQDRDDRRNGVHNPNKKIDWNGIRAIYLRECCKLYRIDNHFRCQHF